MADAKQKRTYAADEIADLNAKLAKLEALSDKLGEEIKELNDAIEKLNEYQQNKGAIPSSITGYQQDWRSA